MSLPKTPRNTIIARHKPSNTAPNPSKPRYQPATMALPTSPTRFLRVSSCRTWMDANLNTAVTDARLLILPNGTVDDSQMPTVFNCTFNGTKGRAKCNVLEDFGLTLHASEDFYSHTNWADIPDPARPPGSSNPPGLGMAVPSPWIDLRVVTPFPAGLMSGCFESIPERFYCNEGPGGRVKHAFLNKDTGTIDPAIRGGDGGCRRSIRG